MTAAAPETPATPGQAARDMDIAFAVVAADRNTLREVLRRIALGQERDPSVAADKALTESRKRGDALAARQPQPAPGLRGDITQIAAGLKREADLIEADRDLNPLIRPAIAEAYRTAAGRIGIALSDDSRRPARSVRDGIGQALANLRRMGDGCAPSRAAQVRAALAECERAVREAYGEDR